MKTTCAYCYHEVAITKDGTCSYCGGNLAIKPIKEKPDSWFGKSRLERVQDFLGIEPDPPTIMQRSYPAVLPLPLVKQLIKESEKNQQSKAELEIKELDDFRRTINKSETIKELQKALTQSIFPRWFKFVAFLIGLSLSLFYTLPFLQEPILELFSLINSSPLSIMFMSIVPIFFILAILKKVERL